MNCRIQEPGLEESLRQTLGRLGPLKTNPKLDSIVVGSPMVLIIVPEKQLDNNRVPPKYEQENKTTYINYDDVHKLRRRASISVVTCF